PLETPTLHSFPTRRSSDLGDIMMPFEPIVLPPLEHLRPFGPLMTTTSGIKGEIVSTKTVLLSYGSRFAGPNIQPGVGGTRLGMIDRKSTRLNSSHVAISYA